MLGRSRSRIGALSLAALAAVTVGAPGAARAEVRRDGDWSGDNPEVTLDLDGVPRADAVNARSPASMRYWKWIGWSIANRMLRQPGSDLNWSIASTGLPGAGIVGGVGAVLGHSAWDALVEEHGYVLLAEALTEAIREGNVDDLPVAPLTRMLAALISEASLYIARADDHVRAREEAGLVLERLLTGLGRGATAGKEPSTPGVSP